MELEHFILWGVDFGRANENDSFTQLKLLCSKQNKKTDWVKLWILQIQQSNLIVSTYNLWYLAIFLKHDFSKSKTVILASDVRSGEAEPHLS